MKTPKKQNTPMKTHTLILLASLAVTLSARAALIIPDTATASSEFNANYLAVNTINGSGMPIGYDTDSAHADYAVLNHWTTSTGDVIGAWIDWGFDTPATLGQIFIWTHRSNNIAVNSSYSPTRFDLELFDDADVSLLLWENVALGIDTEFAQGFTFPAIIDDVSRVRFTVLETPEPTSFTGLAEVAFTAVPEPSSTLLLGAGFSLLLLRSRRNCPR
jgi:hypothetical protein